MRPNKGTSEDELIRLLRDPKRQHYAFRLLVEQYQERLYWHIRRMVVDHDDADDVLQNTLIKTWNALDKFRGDSGLYTWIYRIATNECLSFLRKKKTRFFLPIQNIEGELAESLSADSWFDGDEAQLKLQKALLKLPDKQRLVFNLKYYDEMKYEDMSAVLGTSVGALKASYHHAVKKIGLFLNPD